MLKHSHPFGYHVSDKCKESIWTDSYGNFANLLPLFISENNDDGFLFERFHVTISSKKHTPKKEINTIHLWTNAFDIFMSIYLAKFSHMSLLLIKYGYNIRAISKQFGFQAAKSYDEHFRQVRNEF